MINGVVERFLPWVIDGARYAVLTITFVIAAHYVGNFVCNFGSFWRDGFVDISDRVMAAVYATGAEGWPVALGFYRRLLWVDG